MLIVILQITKCKWYVTSQKKKKVPSGEAKEHFDYKWTL